MAEKKELTINGPTHLYHPDFDGYKEVKTQTEYELLIDKDDRWSDQPYPEEVEEAVEEVKVPASTMKLKPAAKKKGRK